MEATTCNTVFLLLVDAASFICRVSWSTAASKALILLSCCGAAVSKASSLLFRCGAAASTSLSAAAKILSEASAKASSLLFRCQTASLSASLSAWLGGGLCLSISFRVTVSSLAGREMELPRSVSVTTSPNVPWVLSHARKLRWAALLRWQLPLLTAPKLTHHQFSPQERNVLLGLD